MNFVNQQNFKGLWHPLQVIDAAMEAGAEDVQTTEGEDGEFAGFKVRMQCCSKHTEIAEESHAWHCPCHPLLMFTSKVPLASCILSAIWQTTCACPSTSPSFSSSSGIATKHLAGSVMDLHIGAGVDHVR